MTAQGALTAVQAVAAVLAAVVAYVGAGVVSPTSPAAWIALLVASILVACGIVATVVVTIGRRER